MWCRVTPRCIQPDGRWSHHVIGQQAPRALRVQAEEEFDALDLVGGKAASNAPRHLHLQLWHACMPQGSCQQWHGEVKRWLTLAQWQPGVQSTCMSAMPSLAEQSTWAFGSSAAPHAQIGACCGAQTLAGLNPEPGRHQPACRAGFPRGPMHTWPAAQHQGLCRSEALLPTGGRRLHQAGRDKRLHLQTCAAAVSPRRAVPAPATSGLGHPLAGCTSRGAAQLCVLAGLSC